MAYETAWSGSTGWTNGNGRYLAVPLDPPQPTAHELAAQCQAVSPVPIGRPKSDIEGTVRERILHQLEGGQWMSASQIAKRLGIHSQDKSAYQNLSHAIRALWMDGTLQRTQKAEAGYHRFGTLMYRRKSGSESRGHS